MRQVLAVAIALVVGLALSTGLARAQGENKAAAEAAFRQGRELMATKDYVAACAAFRSSQTLDPQLGTQYNLGLCYEKAGMLASAWGELTDLAARDSNPARKKDATKRAAAIEPKLVRLLLVVRGATPGLVVRKDGNDITPIVGVATPVDPGESTIEASATGYVPFTFTASLAGEGSTVTVEIPALAAVPPPPPPPPDEVLPPPEEIKPPAPPPVIDRDPGKGRRRLGLVIGVAGVAGLGVGSAFGVMAISANADARDTCGGDVADCRGDAAAASELVDTARSRGTISTIALGVGAAALVAGTVLYLTAPAKLAVGETTALVPTATRSQLGLALVGRF